MTKLEDTLYCSVWSGPEATHGLAVWVVFVLLPIALGPILATLLEILYSLAKRCSSTQVQGNILHTILETAPPTRVFSWLKAATTAFTFKNLFRLCAKQALTRL